MAKNKFSHQGDFHTAHPFDSESMSLGLLWFVKTNGLSKFVILTISALILSPVGWNYVLNFGGIYVPEIFILLLLFASFFASKRSGAYLAEFVLSSRNILWVLLVSLLALWGVFAFHGDVAAAYTDMRAIILMGIAYNYLRKASARDAHHKLQVVYCLCFFSCLFYVISYYYIAVDAGSEKFLSPYPAMIAMAAIGIYYKSVWMGYSAIFYAIFFAIIGFYRANYFISVFIVLGVAFFIFHISFRSDNANNRGAWLTMAALIGAAIFFGGQISEFVLDFLTSNESRQIQSIMKMENLAVTARTGELGGGDSMRLRYLSEIANNLVVYILPSGLGHKALIDSFGSLWSGAAFHMPGANTLDGGHLFLACHFGIFVGLILIVLTVFRWVYSLIFIRSLTLKISRACLCLASVIIFVSTGTMFAQFSMAVSFGFLVAFLSDKGLSN